jgi:hypothetical protein
MLKLETKADLDALHLGNIKESISLEYKASSAIDKKDNNRRLKWPGTYRRSQTQMERENTGRITISYKAGPDSRDGLWTSSVMRSNFQLPHSGD